MTIRLLLSVAILLWLAAALQQSVAPYATIVGCPPDFLLAVLLPTTVFLSRAGGAVLGFIVGTIHGALPTANLAHYATSRAITGFVGAWMGSTTKTPSLGFVVLHAILGTAIGQVLLMFLAPPDQIDRFLLVTIGTAVYNGVIALPVFLLLRRILRRDSD